MLGIEISGLHEDYAESGRTADGPLRTTRQMPRFAVTAEAWMRDRPGDVREMLAMHQRLVVEELLIVWDEEIEGGCITLLDAPYVAAVLGDICALAGATPPALVGTRINGAEGT
jgi:hypothetical protein